MESTGHKSSSYESILLYESGKHELNDIIYFDDLGNQKRIKDSIRRIDQSTQVHWVELARGDKINIEKVYSVDGEVSPYYESDFFKCDCV